MKWQCLPSSPARSFQKKFAFGRQEWFARHMTSNNPCWYFSLPTSGKKCLNRDWTAIVGSSEPGKDASFASAEALAKLTAARSSEILVACLGTRMKGASETIREPLEMNRLATSPLPFPGMSVTRKAGPAIVSLTGKGRSDRSRRLSTRSPLTILRNKKACITYFECLPGTSLGEERRTRSASLDAPTPPSRAHVVLSHCAMDTCGNPTFILRSSLGTIRIEIIMRGASGIQQPCAAESYSWHDNIICNHGPATVQPPCQDRNSALTNSKNFCINKPCVLSKADSEKKTHNSHIPAFPIARRLTSPEQQAHTYNHSLILGPSSATQVYHWI